MTREAVSASPHAPGIITPPVGMPVYYGFQVLEDVAVDRFVFGMITDFEVEPCAEGDAFVIAPDNSRSGLVWEVGEPVSISEVLPIEATRWGVWAVTIPYEMSSRENVRRNLELIVPMLKEKWEKSGDKNFPLDKDIIMAIEKRTRKQNVTVRLNRQTIRKAKILAARRSTSLSELVAGRIEIIFGEEESYERLERQTRKLLKRGFHLGGGARVGRDELHERNRSNR